MYICEDLYNSETKDFGIETEDSSVMAYAIVENLNNDYYDEMLDECYGEIDICGCSYCPSIALYRVDPIAYNCGMNDYYDSVAKDIEYEIDRMCSGDSESFYDFVVECIEDDDEEDDEEYDYD